MNEPPLEIETGGGGAQEEMPIGIEEELEASCQENAYVAEMLKKRVEGTTVNSSRP